MGPPPLCNLNPEYFVRTLLAVAAAEMMAAAMVAVGRVAVLAEREVGV